MSKSGIEKCFITKDVAGILKIDVDLAIKHWDDDCCITQYGQKYWIYKEKNGEVIIKASIDKKDAEIIIKSLELIKINNEIFKYSKVYKTKAKILQIEDYKIKEITCRF